MLFLGTIGADLGVVVRVGAFGVGAFWLSHYGPGAAVQPVASQAQQPYQDTANFLVPAADLNNWGWATQGFVIRVVAMSQHAEPMPILLELVQNHQVLQALDAQNQPLNGTQPPFGSVLLDTLTNGETKDFPFGVFFQ
jgi:hypothetical protein